MEEEKQFNIDEEDKIKIESLSDKYDELIESFVKPLSFEELNFKIAKHNLSNLEQLKEITKSGKYQQIKVNLNIVPGCNQIETKNIYNARVVGFYITGQSTKYNVFIKDNDSVDVLIDKGRAINRRRWCYESLGIVVGSKLNFETDTDQLVTIFLYLE